jgi:hypothetical protein
VQGMIMFNINKLQVLRQNNIHQDLKFAREVSELSCTLTPGLNAHLLYDLMAKTLNKDKVYFENVCMKQYTHFGVSAVIIIKIVEMMSIVGQQLSEMH